MPAPQIPPALQKSLPVYHIREGGREADKKKKSTKICNFSGDWSGSRWKIVFGLVLTYFSVCANRAGESNRGKGEDCFGSSLMSSRSLFAERGADARCWDSSVQGHDGGSKANCQNKQNKKHVCWISWKTTSPAPVLYNRCVTGIFMLQSTLARSLLQQSSANITYIYYAWRVYTQTNPYVGRSAHHKQSATKTGTTIGQWMCVAATKTNTNSGA